ncbi:hypothetical protein LCGC14_1405920 [marine sediment metagenome]|uniref:SF4 helicase domain-containing protein n=1 Tax=marine sediment metagenome TaxID=412755 RepID=A0A0F9JW12_9ZZZZ
MRTLEQSLRTEHVVGEKITLPWRRLNEALSLHTKELCIVAGAPSSGKSVIATNLAMRLSEPVLYLAQDSSPSIIARLAALATRRNLTDVFDALRDPETMEEMASAVKGKRPLLAIQTGATPVDRVAVLVEAAAEWLGYPPPVVIVDNLIDLIVPGFHHQDGGFYATALPVLKRVAEDYNVCIIALHHVTRRAGANGGILLPTSSPSLMDLLHAGEREAEHVVGVYHDHHKTKLNLTILKQRDGEADSGGGLRVPMLWHAEQGRISQWTY